MEILVSHVTAVGLAEQGQYLFDVFLCLCSRPFLLEVLLDMEGKCTGAESGLNDYRKRYAGSADGLMFMLGPGGRAAVVAMQTSDEPQTVAPSQISGAQAIILPLSPAVLSNDASATVTGASGAPTDTIAQLSPTTSSAEEPVTSTDPTDQSTQSNILPEAPTMLASFSTDGAFTSSSSEAATASSLQPSLPTTVSSEAVNAKPQVYAGIVLGTIAGVACITALFAWWVRIRSHAKRRRLYGDKDVPWALSENGDSGLEEARDMTQTRTNLESIGLGGREDLAEVEAWEPRGDRDVGEPRRSESYAHGSGPFMHVALEPHSCHAAPTIPGQHDSILSFIQPCQNGPYPGTRALPSYLQSIDSSYSGSVDDDSAASSLGALHVANLLPGDRSAATSRATTALGMNNHMYSSGTEDFDDLLRAEGRSPLDHSAYSWTRSIQKEPNTTSEQCEQPATTPEPEGWTSSLKSIFTVMASNLSIRGGSAGNEDILTPIPSRRSNRVGDLAEDVSPDGHRVVYPESITERNPCSAVGADRSRESNETHKQLTGRKNTQSGQLRRDLLSRSAKWHEQRPSQDTPSRASSVYSNASAGFAVDYRSEDASLSTTPSRNGTLDRIYGRQGSKSEENLHVSRPPVMSRVSSTGCSVASSQLPDTEDAAQRALVDRRRRARRHEDWAAQEGSAGG